MLRLPTSAHELCSSCRAHHDAGVLSAQLDEFRGPSAVVPLHHHMAQVRGRHELLAIGVPLHRMEHIRVMSESQHKQGS